MKGNECDFMSVPGNRSSQILLLLVDDSGGRSPLIIKDLDLYPQPPTNTRSPTLNSEEPGIWQIGLEEDP